MAEIDLTTIIAIVGTLGTVVGIPLVAYIVKARGKLTAFRQLIDALDDAQQDGKVTEEESRTIRDAWKKLIT